MLAQRNRVLPIRWMDLETFDRAWLEDKTVVPFTDRDGVQKVRVFDKDGTQVYPRS